MIPLDEANPKHRAFSRLVIAQRDIDLAHRAISHIATLKASNMDDIYEMLITAAAILYSRPFIATKAYPRIPAKFARFDKSAFQTFHDEMVSFRNRFVAHCDTRDVKVQILPKGTQFRGSGNSVFTVHKHGTGVTTLRFQPKGLPLFKAVCSFQLARLGKEIDLRSHLSCINPNPGQPS
jgi:hypothetical protein